MLNEAKVKNALTDLRLKINQVENASLKKELNLALLLLMNEVIPDDYLFQMPVNCQRPASQSFGTSPQM